jgi:hypothetical protein
MSAAFGASLYGPGSADYFADSPITPEAAAQLEQADPMMTGVSW